MSDQQLARAVHEEAAAFRPDHTPPFERLLARKRSRDRRAAAAGALAVAGVVAAAALAVPALTGGQDRLPSFAGPTPAATEPATSPSPTGPRKLYVLQYADADAYQQHRPAVDECLALPWTDDARDSRNVPPVASVMVSGADENTAFVSCVAEIDGVTVAAETEYVWADAPWAVQEISPDRRSVTVRAHGIAAGCTGPGRATAKETPDGIRLRVQVDVPADPGTPCGASLPMVKVTVDLPRPLGQGETVLGECVPDEQTPEGKQCQQVRAFASLPPPSGD